MSALDKIHAVMLGSREGSSRQNDRTRHLKMVAVVVALASVAIAVGAIDTSRRMLPLLTSGDVAEGRIVGFQAGLHQDNRGPGPSDRRTYMPIIEFTPKGGRPVQFVSGVGTSLTAGSSASIRYNPANPSEAEVDSFFNILFLLVWPWVMSLAFAGTALFLWRIAPRMLAGRLGVAGSAQ